MAANIINPSWYYADQYYNIYNLIAYNISVIVEKELQAPQKQTIVFADTV